MTKEVASFHCLLTLLLVWDLAWKAVAMWKAARKGQKSWYVCIAIFSTVGLLPIIYLLLNRKKAIGDKA